MLFRSGVSATFNVADLSLFDVGDDLGANRLEEGGNDATLAREITTESIELPRGPITRSRAKRFRNAIASYVERAWEEGVAGFDSRASNRSKGVTCNLLQAEFVSFN